MATNPVDEKEMDSAKDVNVIHEVPTGNVSIDVEHPEDKKKDKAIEHDDSCDIAGDKLEPGDFIIIFSDDMNPDMPLDKAFEGMHSEEEDSDYDHVKDIKVDADEGSIESKPLMPKGLIPAILQAISEGTVVASPINYYTKYASTDFYQVPSYQVAKISDCSSYEEAITKLYSNIHSYNVLRDSFILDQMLS